MYRVWWEASCFLQVPLFPSQNKFDRLNIAEMLLTVALSTITANPNPIPFIGVNVESGILWKRMNMKNNTFLRSLTPLLQYTNFIVCICI